MLSKKITIVLIFLSYFFSQAVLAITISASDLSYTLPETVTNAGDYYPTTIETHLNSSVSISGTINSPTWTVFLSLATPLNGLQLSVKRNDNGTGDVAPEGGLAYVTLNTSEIALFTGQGNISTIGLQFKVDNFDVTDGNGEKNIQVNYRVETN